MHFVELNDKQLERLSEFLSNLAVLIVAELILPNLFNVQRPNTLNVIVGLILTWGLVAASIFIVRKHE